MTQTQPPSTASPVGSGNHVVAIAFFAAAVVLLGLTKMPIGYYGFARWCVTIASVALIMTTWRTAHRSWSVFFIPAAVLWNPFVPVYMTRSAWLPLDVIAGALLLAFGIRSTRFVPRE